MKILHTSDWHLGKKLYGFDRLDEQKLILDEINEIANREQVDCILVAGDLFDVGNPSNEATELFYKSLKKLSNSGTRPVIAIAGNHDSPQRIEAPDPLALECGIVLLGYPLTHMRTIELDSGFKIARSLAGFVELILPFVAYPLRLISTPYASEIRLKQFFGEREADGLRKTLRKHWQKLAQTYCDEKGVNFLLTHLFIWPKDSEPPEEPDGEKPIKIGNASVVYSDLIPSQIQYAALGHLHRSQQIAHPSTQVWYSGSPLAYSFSEVEQVKYVHIVDASPGNDMAVKRVALKSGRALKRATFDNVDDAVRWLKQNADAYSEITMQTDDFLKVADNKRLRDASPLLVSIIPEPKLHTKLQPDKLKIDMNQSVKELFVQYFNAQRGQEPNSEILALFDELVNKSTNP